MVDSSPMRVAEAKRHFFLVSSVRRMVKEKPLGTVGGLAVVVFLAISILADFIAPYGMDQPNVADVMLSPSSKYWFGTDHLGRDIFSRVVFGARISVIVGLSAASISAILSGIIGISSGYLGGKFDLLMQRFVDLIMCFPALLFYISILSFTGPGMLPVIVVMALRSGVVEARVIRGATMAIKENVYIQAAKAIGCSSTRILTKHILPNVMSPMIILFSVAVGHMILGEASLSFLGFGIPPPAPSWGGMLSGDSRSYMFQAPWMAIWPGVALSITVFSVGVFGDAIRDILDPRLRGGIGRYGLKAKKLKSKK